MLMKVVVENGVKKLVPLTADAGSGNPCGTIIAVYSNQVPYGYLPCNGVAFDTAQFPVLYALLGDNHTPDLRECTLKGIGESGRTVGAHVKAGGLAVGEFIDDRIQNIKVDPNSDFSGICAWTDGSLVPLNSPFTKTTPQTHWEPSSGAMGQFQSLGFDASKNVRAGATTEVKAVGVNFCIKATSGINENQADNVLSALTPVDTVALNNLHSVTSNAVYPIKEKTEQMYVNNQLNLVRYLPFIRNYDLPSQSTDDHVYFKEWFDWMYDHHYFDSASDVFIGQANPNYNAMVWGFTYGEAQAYQWSLFYYIKPSNPLIRFGYEDGVWFLEEV